MTQQAYSRYINSSEVNLGFYTMFIVVLFNCLQLGVNVLQLVRYTNKKEQTKDTCDNRNESYMHSGSKDRLENF